MRSDPYTAPETGSGTAMSARYALIGGARPRRSSCVRRHAPGVTAFLLVGALTLTACTTHSASTGPAATSTSSTTQVSTRVTTPTAVGSLDRVTWDLPTGEPTSLDWGRAFDYSSHTVLSNLCEGLVQQQPDYSIRPWLAESVEHPNQLTYVYNIRHGVHFWDGNPLTAADVEFSLERELNPKSGAFWGVYFVNVQGIQQTGPYQVTIHMRRPDEIFPELLATYGGFVGEAKYVKAKGASYGTPSGGIMCTGPYKLQSWQSGSSITIVRNDSYWNPSIKPKVREIDFKFLTDPTTLANALSSGAIDGAYEVPVSSVSRLQNTGSGTLYLGESTQWLGMLYSANPGAVADPRVRQALWLATDKSAIAKQVYQNTAIPIRSANFPSVWGFATPVFQQWYNTLPSTASDLTAARQLVQQAHAEHSTVTLAAQSDDPAAVQIAEVVQAAGEQIGLKVVLKLMPGPQIATLNVDPSARKGIGLFLASRFIDIAEPMQLLNEFLPGGQFNYANYDSAQYVNDIQGAYSSTGPARAHLEAQATTLLDNDWAILPLVNTAERLYMSDRITGAPASFGYLYYPWATDLGSPAK